MAYQPALSQDEVDALLQDVTGGATPAATPGPAVPDDGIPRYDLGAPDRVVRGRMQTLELINERFARHLRSGILNYMRRSPDITVGPLEVQQYNEFIRHLPVPANINILEFRPLRGMGVVVFDPKLVFLVVDHLFGSDGRFAMRVEGREFSPAEQRIIQRLLKIVLDCYAEAWKQVKPLDFHYVRSEMHGKLANIVAPNEVVVSTTLQVEIGPTGGFMSVCLPYSMLEPVRDLLSNPVVTHSADAGDRRWMKQMSHQMNGADLDLSVDFVNIHTTVGELLQLEVGHVIPIELPKRVTARADHTPLLECSYGNSNGRYALQVERMIDLELEAQSDE